MKGVASGVAATSLSHQQRKRSLNARNNKASAVKSVLCTPYVAKWLVDSHSYAFFVSQITSIVLRSYNLMTK